MPKFQKLVSIATAHDQLEAIRIKMLLDRTQIPYTVRGELLHSLVIAAPSALGPMEFLVSSELHDQAKAALEELFDIRPEAIPKTCPACDSKTEPGKLECPSCGLFLA